MVWTERYLNATLSTGANNGTSEANAWRSWAVAATNVVAGQRVNVISNHDIVTTLTTLAVAGTTTSPIWWRAYASTIGDGGRHSMDHQILVSGAFNILENFDTFGSFSANEMLEFSGTADGSCAISCTMMNTNGSNTVPAARGQDTNFWLGCYAEHANDRGFLLQAGNYAVGCIAKDCGGDGYDLDNNAQNCFLDHCMSLNNGGDGVRTADHSRIGLYHCTIHGNTGDGLEFTDVGAFENIVGCLFSNNGGYGINNSLGTNIATAFRAHNAFANNTSGNENGFGDHPDHGQVDLSDKPADEVFVDAAGDDYTLAVGSKARNVGCAGEASPGLFLDDGGTAFGTTGHMNIGAVQ